MDDCHIRLIEPRDVERVLGIITRHDESEEDDARDFFKRCFDSNHNPPSNSRHYVIELEDEPIGVGGYVFVAEKNEYWVGFLYVDTYYQGQGLGSLLLERICLDVRKLGADSIYVGIEGKDIPTQMVGFYEVNGFAPTDQSGGSSVPPTVDYKVYRKPLGD